MSPACKVALITGGATGIGFGTAKVLAERGMRVAIAQPDAARGREAVKRLKPTEVVSFELDIRDHAAVNRCVDAVVQHWGAIDVLVNNASVTGRTGLSPFIEATPEHVDRVVDTNLKGTFYCSQ